MDEDKEEKVSLKAESQHSSSTSFFCVPHLVIKLPLWARLLLVVFGIHAHVEFVLAEGAAQQGEHQEEPHGSAGGGHDRQQLQVHFLFLCRSFRFKICRYVSSRWQQHLQQRRS